MGIPLPSGQGLPQATRRARSVLGAVAEPDYLERDREHPADLQGTLPLEPVPDPRQRLLKWKRLTDGKQLYAFSLRDGSLFALATYTPLRPSSSSRPSPSGVITNFSQ